MDHRVLTQALETTRSSEEAWGAAEGGTIPARFETWVRRQPEHLALRADGLSLTYAELNRQANRIAHALLKSGFDRDFPVVIALGQGTSQIAAAFGILKAGGFYVALDPRNPLERNRLILSQSCAKILLTDAMHRHSMPASPEAPLDVLELDRLGEEYPSTNPDVEIAPHDLACLVYTSGSTGRPKGVMHNHETLLHNMERHAREFRITPADRQSLIYSPAVYGGHRDSLNGLLNGASVHLYPLLSEGITHLPRWLQEEAITIFCSVVTVFRQFLRLLAPGEQFPALRLIKLGGERSYVADIEACRQRLPGANMLMHCGYGSSETGLCRTLFIDAGTPVQGEIMPLGYALPDPEVLLLDANGQVADEGEIVIRSRYITPGYWQDEALTRRVLRTDETDPSRRIYHTGDLGRLDPEGRLWFAGRADFQVRINGNRVQVDEVEAAVKRLPSVQDAVVVARHDTKRGDSLEACMVARAGTEPPSVRDLRAQLGETLPTFMVPGTFRWLDELPQLPNGKVDRRRLTEMAVHESQPDHIPAPEASTRTEREIIRIWCDVLGRAAIGPADDFFELGGDSLRGMVMIATVARELGVQVPLAELLNSSQPRTFAAVVDRSGTERRFQVLVPFRTRGNKPPFFCVHGVYGGVLFLRDLVDRLDSEQPFYAFQPPGLDGSRFGFASIAGMAGHYIEAMKTVQPEGPYLLGGYSFGGKVAFEMACQVQARGEGVHRLVIFDSTPPPMQDSDATSDDFAEAEFGPTLRNHLRGTRRKGRSPTRWLADSFEIVRNELQPWFNHHRLRFGGRLDGVERESYLFWNHRRLSRSYQSAPYAGEAVVFASEKRADRLMRGWSACIDGHVTLHTVDSDHSGLFTLPGVVAVARDFSACLSGDEADPGGK